MEAGGWSLGLKTEVTLTGMTELRYFDFCLLRYPNTVFHVLFAKVANRSITNGG